MKKKIFLLAVMLPCIIAAVTMLFAFTGKGGEAEKQLPGLITETECFFGASQRDEAYQTALNVTHQYHLIVDNDSYTTGCGFGCTEYCYVIKYYE